MIDDVTLCVIFLFLVYNSNKELLEFQVIILNTNVVSSIIPVYSEKLSLSFCDVITKLLCGRRVHLVSLVPLLDPLCLPSHEA